MNWNKLIYLVLFLVCAAAVSYYNLPEKGEEQAKPHSSEVQKQSAESQANSDLSKVSNKNEKKPSVPKVGTSSKSGQQSTTQKKQSKEKQKSSTTKSGQKSSKEKAKRPNPAEKFGVKKFQWKSVSSRGAFTSPEGLIYGPGKEHRLAHVLRHAADQPNRRGPHGVFDGGPDKTLVLLDQAYAKVKKKSKDVKTLQQGPRTVYEIQMRRRIGYVGGQTGNKKGKPAVYKVKIVMAGKNVITAFPF